MAARATSAKPSTKQKHGVVKKRVVRTRERHQSPHSWVSDYQAVTTWMTSRHGTLERQLDAEPSGVVVVPNFLPNPVATWARQVLRRLPSEEWADTYATQDVSHNNISHSFRSSRGSRSESGAALQDLLRAVSEALPGRLSSFSAARYATGDHIVPHDDKAFTQVRLDTGEEIEASREIALIWYLTPAWRAEYGGLFVDCQAGRTVVPAFNTAVLFRVPHLHEVTAMTSGAPPRYSIFGWFLRPGRMYELDLGESREKEAGARKDGRRTKALSKARRRLAPSNIV
ncbi:hypothetical protein H632_c1942p0 [Helicosporidium sp. ATCC 50920]|nr:hypothetical protein H632_c1942p0 [Helicosporidium sp. ATCC 50920]|eukprot:KDD73671.1 hypothetical protein H632_c1942p0 [Helicosporidium sp. ATCC 50920]